MKYSPIAKYWPIAVTLGFLLLTSPRPGSAQSSEGLPAQDSIDVWRNGWLGTARLPVDLVVDSGVLPAGTYRVRLTGERPPMPGGQGTSSEQWVEFVQGDQVRGRALAPIIPPSLTQQVLRGTPPAPGTARVERLREDRYYRVWFNHRGTQVLLHLPMA